MNQEADNTRAYLDLLDYRRRVAAIYAGVRNGESDMAERHRRFREQRDELFRTHPQSALAPEQRARFTGLHYWQYNPSYRFVVPVEPVEREHVYELDLGDDGIVRMKPFGTLGFTLAGQACTLTLFWLMGYSGGLFLPFADTTSGQETYGAGRYLFDTVKNTDGLALELEAGSNEVTIDFNYAYNPSCAYSPLWACPLAPPENRLPVAVRAGELTYPT